MASKTNMTFFKAYIELDNACAQLLGVEKGGVSAYISELINTRYAPGRSEALPKLIKYRKIRNALAHEENAFKDIHEISKTDIQWINYFSKRLRSKRDPISRYNQKNRFQAIWKKVRIAAFLVLGAVIAVAIYLIVDYFTKNTVI